MESHGSTDADQRLINSKGGKSLVVQYICRVDHSEPLHHQTLWAYFPAASLLAHSVIYWCTDIQFILPVESWSGERRKICEEIITQRDWSWRWGLQAHTHNHRDKCSERKCADTVVVPDMVGGSSQVKQMQSLWPEWIWHPLKCGLLLSLLPPSINLSLHCLLLLLPFSPGLFLLYLQSLYQLYLAPHFPLIFFFLLCLFSFSLWSQCKTSAGTPQSVTLLVWPWVCSSVEMTPDLAGLHFTF